MPIHDQGYRRYSGTRAQAGHAWLVIAQAGVRTLLAKRAFLGLLLEPADLPFDHQQEAKTFHAGEAPGLREGVEGPELGEVEEGVHRHESYS